LGFQLDKKLPAAPPRHGVRAWAASLFSEAQAAAARLDEGSDTEALHDFRVSLRRLRSMLRAFRTELDPPIPKELLRRLKKIAAATGSGRDAEVQAAYLKSWENGFPPAKRGKIRRLRKRLEARREQDSSRGVDLARKDFQAMKAELDSALNPEVGAQAGGSSFSEVLGALVVEAASELRFRLDRIRSAEDEKRCHRARICGKRLRYLMEPLRKRSAAWNRGLRSLKTLQDILGELHDMHLLRAEHTGGASTNPSGLELRIRQKEKTSFTTLQRSWNRPRRERFFRKIAGLTRALAPRPKGPC